MNQTNWTMQYNCNMIMRKIIHFGGRNVDRLVGKQQEYRNEKIWVLLYIRNVHIFKYKWENNKH